MIFTKYINQFERELIIKNYSQRSIECYKSCVNKYLNNFNQYPERISKDEIKNYLLQQFKHNSPEHIVQVISSLKKFYVLVINQPKKLDGIDNPKRHIKLIEPLSKEEILRLFSVIKNVKHLAIVKTIYYGGLRISELLNLKWSDLKRDRKLMLIRMAKGNKDRYVKLFPEVIEILEIYWRQYRTKEYIFSGQGSDQYSDSSIRQFLALYSQHARLSKKCNPHLLRHSLATHFLESGVDIRYIQTYLGHKSSKTTERYTFVSNRNIAGLLSPLNA
ncbi:MAG: site-specific integrase [Melioribacteraceae bacterium]|jgi:site-specific recombinase XerD|nr:site-specific integrase [Melioribacteraceae bacterium]